MYYIHRWVLLSLFLFLAIYHRELIEQITSVHHIFHDTDDAMRLVQVRDWLAGQSWWDLHQYRLYPENPVIMHWSRLVDVPIAGLILLFKPFVGQFHAELITRTVWPFMLFGVFSLFYFKLCAKLAGQEILLYAATLLAMNVFVTAQFAPGRIDHHSVQLVGLMMALWLVFGAEQNRRNGLVLGGVLAFMLTIGFETLPLVVGFGVIIVLRWVNDGTPEFIKSSGLGLVTALYGLYFLTHPIAEFWQPYCDAIAMPGLLLFGGAGIVMLALGYIPAVHGRTRLIVAVLGGIAAFMPFALAAPHCLGNPYEAVDPLLKTEWLAYVQEAQPFLKALIRMPESTIPLLIYALTATVLLAYAIYRRFPYAALFSILFLVSLAATAWQVRAGYFMVTLAMLVAVIAIARCNQLRGAESTRSLLRMTILLMCVPFLHSLAFEAITPRHTRLKTHYATCMDYTAIQRLQQYPPGLVLAPIDIGPNILAHTHHSVVSAPYHRNNAGNLATLAPASQRAKIIQELGVRYQYICTPGQSPSVDVLIIN